MVPEVMVRRAPYGDFWHVRPPVNHGTLSPNLLEDSHMLRNTLFCLAVSILAHVATGADLQLEIINITEPVGTINWSLFDSPEHYQQNQNPVMTARNRVNGDSLQLTLHDLPPGTYAVKLFHDVNGNGELDTNLVGMPVEGYGFSNDAGRFGPAAFGEAAVKLDDTTRITLRVR